MSATMSEIDALIHLTALAERLEALPRSGWLFSGVTSPENVAAHSFNVAMVAMLLADQVGADPGRCVQLALLHDLAEAQTTDIPGPAKAELVRPGAEKNILLRLTEGLPNLTPLVEELNAGTSLEARVVKAADYIQMVQKACQYARQQRGDVRRFLSLRSTGMPQADAWVERLLERHKAHQWDDVEYGN